MRYPATEHRGSPVCGAVRQVVAEVNLERGAVLCLDEAGRLAEFRELLDGVDLDWLAVDRNPCRPVAAKRAAGRSKRMSRDSGQTGTLAYSSVTGRAIAYVVVCCAERSDEVALGKGRGGG